MTRTTAEKITKQGIPIIVQRLGHSSSTPRELVIGLPELGSLNLMDIEIHQGAGNVMQLACQISQDNYNAKLMMTALQWWRFKLGTQEIPFHYDNSQVQYIDSVWLDGIHRFIHQHKLQIVFGKTESLHQRVNDVCLMDYVMKLGLPQKIVRYINQCRLFIGATTLSDITNLQGSEVERSCYIWGEAQKLKVQTIYYKEFPRNSVAPLGLDL